MSQLVIEHMDGQFRYYPFDQQPDSPTSWTHNISGNEIVVKFPGKGNRTHIPLCNVRNYHIEIHTKEVSSE